jgi:hypothetical protein
VRLLDVIQRWVRPHEDERSRRGRQVDYLVVKSEVTVKRVDRLAGELDEAIAAIRRRR